MLSRLNSFFLLDLCLFFSLLLKFHGSSSLLSFSLELLNTESCVVIHFFVVKDCFNFRSQLIKSLLFLSNQHSIFLSKIFKFSLNFLLSSIVLSIQLINLILKTCLNLRVLDCLFLNLLSQSYNSCLKICNFCSN